MDNLKAFLEADALRTQGEWPLENAPPSPHDLQVKLGDDMKIFIIQYAINYPNDKRDRNKANGEFIAAASRIAPDIRQLLASFEQVCEALERAKSMHSRAAALYRLSSCGNAAYNEDLNYSINLSFDALTAAAPYRKLMRGV